jgi:hypothetical protein
MNCLGEGKPRQGEGFRGECVSEQLRDHENANLMTLQIPDCVHEKLMTKTEGEMMWR